MVVWHYDDGIWVIDTHIIAEHLGGNGNVILKVFCDVKSCLSWIYQRLVSINVRTGYQQVYSVQIEMNASNGIASSQKSVNETHSVNGDDPASGEFSSFRGKSKELLHTNWQQVQIESFGPDKIPYIADVREKISNSDAYFLVQSGHARANRVPQACRSRSIFLLDRSAFGMPKDVQSDLNGVFSICKEIKSTAVVSKKNMETYTVKEVGKSTKANGEIIQMHVHRTEKKDIGLIRNIVYFSKEQELINNTLILQYYFNKFVPSDTSELLFDVEAHGNSILPNKEECFERHLIGTGPTR